LYGQTDRETLFHLYFGNQSIINSNFNASGTTTANGTYFVLFFYCYGTSTVTASLDDIELYTYTPNNYSNNPITPAPRSVLTNGNFQSGLQNWRWEGGPVDYFQGMLAGSIAYATVNFNSLLTNSTFVDGSFIQDVVVDPGQTFRIQAQVSFWITDGLCSCSAAVFNYHRRNDWAWQTQGVNATIAYNLEIKGMNYNPGNRFQLYAGCEGTAVCSVGFRNIYMTVNV
jgi:hypothetical protein